MLESLDEAQQRQRQLVQDASHELRTPLTSLRTNIEVLASQRRAAAGRARSSSSRDVVAQLGEMTDADRGADRARARRGAADRRSRRCGSTSSPRTRSGARRATTPTSRSTPTSRRRRVVGMPASLERAIANLLDNAAKWSPPGAPIDVRLARRRADRARPRARASRRTTCRTSSSASTARPRRAACPARASASRSSSQVAEAHGGTVVAEEAPGGGTLMRLTLEREQGGARHSTHSRKS